MSGIEISFLVVLGLLGILAVIFVFEDVILGTTYIPLFAYILSFALLFIFIVVLALVLELKEKEEWEERERAEQEVCDKMWDEFVETEKLADYFIWVEECR